MANRRLLLISGAVFLALVAGFFAMRSGSVDARVVTDLEPVRCEGAEVGRGGVPPEEDSDTFSFPTVDMQPGMDCRLRFFVENTSDSPILIDSIVLPFLGPQTGTSATAVHLNPTYNSASELDVGGIDAGWSVQDEVLPTEIRFYEAFLKFHPDGCSTPGSMFSMDWPVVTLDSGQVLPSDAIRVGFVGTEFSSCDG